MLVTQARRSWASSTLALLAALLVLLVVVVQAAAKDYYAVMGVDRKADDRTIKRAYRKLAQKLHPDKHPEKNDEFVAMSHAYQVLSDAKLRKIYDRYGEDGVKQHQQQAAAGGHGGAQDPFNVFRDFFGGGGGPFGQAGPRRGPSKQYNLEVALEDMYLGKKVKIQHERNVLCPACDGSGAKSKADIHTCEKCNGQGIRVVRQQIMPGFITNAQVQCDACAGQGRVIKHVCPRCGGNKVTREAVELDVEIVPGAHEGEEIVFEGDSDEGPDYEAGDVIFSIRSSRQKGDFRRRDTHLYYTHPISLADALLGFEQNISHYDHQVLLRRAGVTQPGYVHVIPNEGMPKRDQEGEKGNLYVEYSVVFPDRVEGDLQKAFEKIFDRTAVRGAATVTHAHKEL